jgi:hypothetical protein
MGRNFYEAKFVKAFSQTTSNRPNQKKLVGQNDKKFGTPHR